MLGDSVQNDVAGGRAAGLRTIWISDGTDGVEADHVVSDAAEAIDLLLDLERLPMLNGRPCHRTAAA